MICRRIILVIYENMSAVFFLLFFFFFNTMIRYFYFMENINILFDTASIFNFVVCARGFFKKTCIFRLAEHINGVFKFSIFILIFCLLDVTFDLRGMC